MKIVGNVVKGGLELLSAKSEDRQKCVDFGSVYFGTDNTESAFLYNNSPEPVCFIAVLNQGTPGEEMVIKTIQELFLKVSRFLIEVNFN